MEYKKAIVAIILILYGVLCYADEPRQTWNFKSNNRKFSLKISEITTDTVVSEYGKYVVQRELKWGLYKNLSKELLYEIPGPISEKTAYISNDGKLIAVINDWPPEQIADSLDLIMIYKDGTLIKEYTVSDLLNCGYNVSSSVSHFEWTWGAIDVDFKNDQIKFRTLELVDYEIRISDGGVLRNRVIEEIDSTSIYAYGKVYGEGGNKYRLEVCHRVYGEVDSTGMVRFNSTYKFHGGWYYSVLLNGVIEIPVIFGKADLRRIILNTCGYKIEKLNIPPMGFENVNCR